MIPRSHFIYCDHFPRYIYVYILFDSFTYNTRGYFASCVRARKNTNNEQNVRAYYMLNHRIRDLLFHYKKILLFWLQFNGKIAEIHLALSVHQYMVPTNGVNNTESQ